MEGNGAGLVMRSLTLGSHIMLTLLRLYITNAKKASDSVIRPLELIPGLPVAVRIFGTQHSSYQDGLVRHLTSAPSPSPSPSLD